MTKRILLSALLCVCTMFGAVKAIEIYDFSTTAANNNDAPPDGFPENMAYGQVNDAAREVMAAIARWHRSAFTGNIITTGTQPNYALSSGHSLSAYADGQMFTFEAHATSTGNVTLNVDGLGASNVVDHRNTQLDADTIVIGSRYTVLRDGSSFRIMSAFTRAFTLNTRAQTTLTIASGAVTVSRSLHYLDTEASAATDDLDTINGGQLSDIIVLRSNDSGRDVTLKNGTGNIACGSDRVLSAIADTIVLMKTNTTHWSCLSFEDNG